MLRDIYLDPSSDSYIGTSFPLFNQTQVQVRADAGGEGGVIFDSSVAMAAGMFPPTVRNVFVAHYPELNGGHVIQPLYNTTLANGTTIISPFGGR